jgi:hypothetical protein
MADEINTIDVFRDSIDVYELSTEAVQIVEQGPQGPPGDGTLGYYGAFSDYTSQTITSITAAYAMTLNTTDESNGVNRGTPTSKIVFTNAATYNVQWSGQFQNTNNSDHDVRVWLKKNGTDISGSTGFASIPSKHGQVDGHTIIGWNYILTLAAGDYLQFYWSADSTAVSIQTYSVGSNPTIPSTASLIVTAQQVMNLQLGPTGPQGPAGTAGGISSVALAGTGLSISGSPVTTSGTITANVSFGTTAGTSTEGNDARIANIGSGTIDTRALGTGDAGTIYMTTVDGIAGSINTSSSAAGYAGGSIFTQGLNAGQGGDILTYDGGGSINTRGTGSIQLGEFGTRTTLNGSASGSDKTITLPNASGTLALQGAITGSGITQATNRILGRTTASTGGVEELTVGSGLTLASGSLNTSSLVALLSNFLGAVKNMTVLAPSADVTVINNTTLAGVSGMSFTAAANTTYLLICYWQVDTGAGGYRMILNVPSNFQGASSQNGYGINISGANSATGVSTIGADALNIQSVSRAAAQTGPTFSIFAFRTTSTGGTTEFRFSQATSTATNSTLKAESRVLVIPLTS